VRAKIAVVAVLMCLWAAGCASVGPKPAIEATVTYSNDAGPQPEKLWPDAGLKEAFSHYWGLRYAGMVEEAFALEAPYFQEMVPIDRYKLLADGTRKNKLIEMEVDAVKKQTDQFFEIHCRSRFKAPDGSLKEAYLVDRWVDVDGTWFHVLRDPVVFPAAS
jgi:hypothetical protein